MNESNLLDESIKPLVEPNDGDKDMSKTKIGMNETEEGDIEIKQDDKNQEDLKMLNLDSPGRKVGQASNSKEVDFHHKVAYRFEKAYRLAKKREESRASLNKEIIQCIRDHQAFIEYEPISLFYCLFFCIYYRNEEMIEFLRTLIQKIYAHDLNDKLLEYIDVNGIDRLRTKGDHLNQLVYHMVFYRAMDDDLRIIYSQILKQLKFIQLRDQDALRLLNSRDYELIRLTFEKHVARINLLNFFPETFPMKS